jgi:hypothetical protein
MAEQNGKENGAQGQKFCRETKEHLRIILKKWTMKKNFLSTQMMEFS